MFGALPRPEKVAHAKHEGEDVHDAAVDFEMEVLARPAGRGHFQE
jgi:hypothetical protein